LHQIKIDAMDKHPAAVRSGVPITILQDISPESLEAIEKIVRRVLEEKQANQVAGQLLSPADACKVFQPQISKQTLARWTAEGLINVQRVGGRLFYRYSDVLAAGSRLKRHRAGK
jgi:hypothetical protein